MKPKDEFTPKGEDSNAIITPQNLERIANPLTIVRGYTQLLQRRLRQGRAVETEELLRILTLIEDSSSSASKGLAALVAMAQSEAEESGPE